MSAADLAETACLLARLAVGAGRAPSSSVEERRDLAVGGVPCDLYLPAGRRRSTVVAVHGVTLAGRRDPRLMAFGRCLARGGVACLVPTVTGLAQSRLRPDDLDEIAAVVEGAAEGAGGRAGLIGFSYGGSYSLLAAARPSLAPRLRLVVAFGAYHDLADLVAHLAAFLRRPPASEAEWEEAVHVALVFALSHRDELRLDARLWAAIESLLRGYCAVGRVDEKRRFFARHLAALDLPSVVERAAARSPALLASLSPAGRLAGIACPVRLVHDRHDRVIPVAHARRLADDLRATPDARLAATSLLAHVRPGNVLRLDEVSRLLAALAPIRSAT